jgi:hypothetical protein
MVLVAVSRTILLEECLEHPLTRLASPNLSQPQNLRNPVQQNELLLKIASFVRGLASVVKNKIVSPPALKFHTTNKK